MFLKDDPQATYENTSVTIFGSEEASGIEMADLPDKKADSQASNGENPEPPRTYQELMVPVTSESQVQDGLTIMLNKNLFM